MITQGVEWDQFIQEKRVEQEEQERRIKFREKDEGKTSAEPEKEEFFFHFIPSVSIAWTAFSLSFEDLYRFYYP